MTTINLLVALLLAIAAFAAFTSLVHSLVVAWRTAQQLAATIGHLPAERAGVTWHDLPAASASSVVQLRPALRKRPAPVTALPELRAAA